MASRAVSRERAVPVAPVVECLVALVVLAAQADRVECPAAQVDPVALVVAALR